MAVTKIRPNTVHKHISLQHQKYPVHASKLAVCGAHFFMALKASHKLAHVNILPTDNR